MFMFNGTDYTIYVIIAVTVIFLFALQYLLCRKTRNRLLRAIPFLLPLVAIAAALISAASFGHNGGFVDLSMVAAGLLAIYALICIIAILLARLVYRYHSRNKSI